MKKTIFLAAIAALYSLVSCQKEDTQLRDSNGDLIFTASIAGPETKTSINATNGKVSWVSGDEITITDAASNSVVYVVDVSTIDSNGTATFTRKSGETGTLGSGPYTATYLKDFNFYSQSYSTAVPSLPMSTEQSNTTSLTFEVSCGLLCVKILASNVNVYRIWAYHGDAHFEFGTPSAPLPINQDIYWALPADTYTNFRFISADVGVNVEKELEVAKNKIYPITVNELSFKTVGPVMP